MRCVPVSWPAAGSSMVGSDLSAEQRVLPQIQKDQPFGTSFGVPCKRPCPVTLTVQAVKGDGKTWLSFPCFFSFQIHRSSAPSCPVRQVNITSSFMPSAQSLGGDCTRLRSRRVQPCSIPLEGRTLGNSVTLHEERLQGFISCSFPVSLCSLHR